MTTSFNSTWNPKKKKESAHWQGSMRSSIHVCPFPSTVLCKCSHCNWCSTKNNYIKIMELPMPFSGDMLMKITHSFSSTKSAVWKEQLRLLLSWWTTLFWYSIKTLWKAKETQNQTQYWLRQQSVMPSSIISVSVSNGINAAYMIQTDSLNFN